MNSRKSFIINEHTFENKISLELRCPICDAVYFINDVDLDRYHRWQKGHECIQNVFPMMSIVDREKLITGMCDNCQDSFYKQFAED